MLFILIGILWLGWFIEACKPPISEEMYKDKRRYNRDFVSGKYKTEEMIKRVRAGIYKDIIPKDKWDKL